MKWMNECIWYNVQINIIADSILNNLNLLFLLFLLSLNIVNFNDNNFTTQSLDDRNWRLLKYTDALATRYFCVCFPSPSHQLLSLQLGSYIRSLKDRTAVAGCCCSAGWGLWYLK